MITIIIDNSNDKLVNDRLLLVSLHFQILKQSHYCLQDNDFSFSNLSIQFQTLAQFYINTFLDSSFPTHPAFLTPICLFFSPS